ncbi:MAG: LytR C-terminal domain-containing protein [Gemmatimonadales bacterium]
MVEVLNAGGPPGAARVGTLLLRRARLDVVAFGNAAPALAHQLQNEVMVRRGDTTGVGRVIAVLGSAQVVDALDSTRMVDLTVLLGRQFVPPAGTPP